MPTIRHSVVGVVSYTIRGGKLTLGNGWEAQNIVTVTIPQLIGIDNGFGGHKGKVRWYKEGVFQLQEAWKEVEARGLLPKVLTYAGDFYPRPIRNVPNKPSNHSFGTAFDINAFWNPLNRAPARRGSTGSVHELVPIFEKWGFEWGGEWRRRDGMHFEIERIISEASAPPLYRGNVVQESQQTFYTLTIGRRKLKCPVFDGKAYVDAGDFGIALGFNVHWDARTPNTIYYDGKPKEVTMRRIGQNNYAPITEVARAIGRKVQANHTTRELRIV